jgi:hypothetical protein
VITRNTQIQGVCKNTVISEPCSCGWNVWLPPLIYATENVARLLKQGTVQLSHSSERATGLTTNGCHIYRRSYRIFLFSAAFRLHPGPPLCLYRSHTEDQFAEVSRRKREANHQISSTAELNALLLASISIAKHLIRLCHLYIVVA